MTFEISPILQQRLDRFDASDLYSVITSDFCAGRSPESVLQAVVRGGVKIVQMREKKCSTRELLQLAERFREITNRYNMLLIINDRIDIALACHADGVHLGQSDMPLDIARTLAPDLILGVSTHSPQQAVETFRAGASYVNLGPIFATQTKETPVKPLGEEVITQALTLESNLRFSCMGGIKAHHLTSLSALGAKHIAMVTEITAAEDIEERVRSLRNLMFSHV